MNVIYQHLWDTFKSSEEKWGADQKKALTGTPTENEHQTGEKTVSLLRGKLLRLQWQWSLKSFFTVRSRDSTKPCWKTKRQEVGEKFNIWVVTFLPRAGETDLGKKIKLLVKIYMIVQNYFSNCLDVTLWYSLNEKYTISHCFSYPRQKLFHMLNIRTVEASVR